MAKAKSKSKTKTQLPDKTGRIGRKARKTGSKNKKRSGVQSVAHLAQLAAIDASHQVHIPPPVSLGPYTVVKGRISIPIATTTANTVVLLGSYGRATAFATTSSPLCAIVGSGPAQPGVLETAYSDAIVVPYAGTTFTNGLANATLHALTVVINCTSSATTANGLCYYAAVNQRVARTNFATYAALGDSLISRREFSSQSAYSLCSKPHKFSAYPVDVVDWCAQRPMVVHDDANRADAIALDSLSQMAIVFPGTVASTSYMLTVYTEWRVNFTDPALSSTSLKREPAPSSLWDRVMQIGTQVSGNFHQAEQAMGSVAAAAGAVGSAYSTYMDLSAAVGQLGTVGKLMSVL